MVINDPITKTSLPIAEFISTSATSTTISSYLFKIKNILEKFIPVKKFLQFSPIIITDFSWAMLNSILKIFNNCQITQYLKWCFSFSVENTSNLNAMPVKIYICSTHFLKIVIEDINKLKLRKKLMSVINLKKHLYTVLHFYKTLER